MPSGNLPEGIFCDLSLFFVIVQTDYLIIGQGISGSFLSWNLLKAGQRVVVIDNNKPNTASKVASGIINPVTGRRIVRTWMIEELLPFAQEAYHEFGSDLGVSVARTIDILTFHASEQMSTAWYDRIADGEDFIRKANNYNDYSAYFNAPYGIGVTSPGLIIDIQLLLARWREKLAAANSIINEDFNIENCSITDQGVSYKGIYAKKVILCNGVEGFENQYFRKLPYALNKGEALLVSIPDLPQSNIYKQGMSIVPVGGELFWVGSSFDWSFEHNQPTRVFRQKVEQVLDSWLKLPYTVVDHKAAIRPSSIERRPFVGLHPAFQNLGILNGMGTKGCSLAPYFSSQLTQYILKNEKIDINVDVSRFARL